MSKLLTMDESGNTQPIAALCLVSMPQQILPKVKKILTISEDDPPEVITLYNKVMEGEFKYVGFRHACRSTGLQVYDDFLKKKLREIATLELEAYYTVFPTPSDNKDRVFRIEDEAQYLFHIWAHQHPRDALDPNLEILIDQQVFHQKHMFQYSTSRGRNHMLIFNVPEEKKLLERGRLKKKLFATGKCNIKEIADGSSKTHKTIQISDMLVGCIRERHIKQIEDYYDLVHCLFHKNRTRVQLESYEVPPMIRI